MGIIMLGIVGQRSIPGYHDYIRNKNTSILYQSTFIMLRQRI